TNPAASWGCGSRACRCSYGAIARKLIDFGRGKSKFSQEIAGIGAERRRRRCRLRIAARQAEARPHDAHGTIDRGHALEGFEQSSLDDLRMLEHGGHVEHFPGRTAALVEERRPFLRRSRRERLLDLSLQFEPTALAILARGEAWIDGKFAAAEQPAQRLELLLLVRGDVQESFAGAERARGAR